MRDGLYTYYTLFWEIYLILNDFIPFFHGTSMILSELFADVKTFEGVLYFRVPPKNVYIYL